MKKNTIVFFACLMLGLLLYACDTISHFDQYAYTQSTSVKVDALNLMDMAAEDYKLHEKDVQAVNTEIEKIYEYDKNRPKNQIVTKMWELLKDSTKNLYGGFIVKWKKEGRMGRTYISEKKDQVGQAFDQISQLESKKIKSSDIKN